MSNNFYKIMNGLPNPPTDGKFSNDKVLISYKRKWMALQIKKRAKCGKCPSRDNLTLDHIVPQDLLNMLGFSEKEGHPENWQVLCRACNFAKGRRLDFSNSKTKLLLVKYLNRLPGIKFKPHNINDTKQTTESEDKTPPRIQEVEVWTVPTPGVEPLWNH